MSNNCMKRCLVFSGPLCLFLNQLFGILFDIDLNKLFVPLQTINPLSDTSFCKKSSPIQQVSFFDGFLRCAKSFICLIKSYLFILLLFSLPVETNLKKITKTYVKELIACLFFQECYGFRSSFRCFNPSEFIFIFGVWKCFTLMLLHVLPSFPIPLIGGGLPPVID